MVELCWIHVWDLKLTNLSGYIDTQIQNDPNRPNQLVSSRMKQSRGRSQRSWAVVEFGRPWHVTSQFVGMVDSTMISIWLVVWNYFLIFFHILGMSSSQLTKITETMIPSNLSGMIYQGTPRAGDVTETRVAWCLGVRCRSFRDSENEVSKRW